MEKLPDLPDFPVLNLKEVEVNQARNKGMFFSLLLSAIIVASASQLNAERVFFANGRSMSGKDYQIDGWGRDFTKGAAERATTADAVQYADHVRGGERLQTSQLGPAHVSLKTGVTFVGREAQGFEKVGPDGKEGTDDDLRSW